MFGIIRDIFVRLSEFYNTLFIDWLYIHFILRTLILLLILCLLLYAAAQVLQYLLIPLAILFFYHVFFRAWNFIFVETLQELIYIRYYADDNLFLREFYHKLCDVVKKNRMILAHTRYAGILCRGTVQKFTAHLTMTALVMVVLGTMAFGLYNEFVTPTDMAAHTDVNQSAATVTPSVNPTQGTVVTTDSGTDKPFPNPADWPADATITFALNYYGAQGSNVRPQPGVRDNTPIEVVRGDIIMEYMGEYALDANNNDSYWLKVKTPSGVVGYISSTLVVVNTFET